ncbi:MAG: lytic transglycosylase domain-containing protein [Burkholderiales bacterium]|nr:MAG: lytic transglycosylase domain-containing protein [Burkholderiales bacterium]
MLRVRSCLSALCLVLGALLSPVAQAQLWGYVDEQGFFHFAESPVDERFTLMLDQPLGEGAVHALAQTRRAATWFDVSVAYKAVRPHLRSAAREHAVDYDLLKAVIATESGFNARAVSHRGAVGLMQLMPSTAAELGVQASASQTLAERLTDPRTNVQAGARYLAQQLVRFDGRLELALAAYNAGAGAVLRAGRRVPDFPETQQYVRKVLRLYEQLRPATQVAGIAHF